MTLPSYDVALSGSGKIYKEKNQRKRHNKFVKSKTLSIACKICGDNASGYHYGLHTCEGCKGFFKRSIEKQHSYEDCRRSCNIGVRNRNNCQYCRYQKCLKYGMSYNAIRFGRMPRADKEKLIVDRAGTLSQQPNLLSLDDIEQSFETYQLIETTSKAFLDFCSLTSIKIREVWKLRCNSGAQANSVRTLADVQYFYPQLDVTKSWNNLNTGILNNSIITLESRGACEQYERNTNHIAQSLFSSQNENVSKQVKETLIKSYHKRLTAAIHELVAFAKAIPYFMGLDFDNQIILLKYGSYEAIFVLLSVIIFEEGILLPLCNVYVTYDCIKQIVDNFMKSKFAFAEKISALDLNDTEMSLFLAVIILSPDRPDLTESKKIENMQEKFLCALRLQLSLTHPNKPRLFASLLVKIADVRRLVEQHVKTIEELDAFQPEQHSLLHEILDDFLQ